MNRIEMKSGKLTSTRLENDIALIDNGKLERFNINSYTIYVHETSTIELELNENDDDIKFEFNICLDSGVELNLYEIKSSLKTKIKYLYNLVADSYLCVKKFNDNIETKEMNIINLNGTNAKADFYFKTIAKSNEVIDVIVNHNIKNTTSNINVDGLTIENGTINLTVTTLIPNKVTGCIASQQNEIIKLNNTQSTIKPLLLIEENEVVANHSARLGSFDEKNLFYLMSRGLTKTTAEKLLIKGFLTRNINEMDIINKFINKYWRWIMNREDFNVLKNYTYLDSAATALKPNSILKTVEDYYTKTTANIHRGDYDIAILTDQKYDHARTLVANFINAKSNEIIFTYNTTDSINKIVFGYFNYHLKENDEILITKAEHASNSLPWFELASNKNIKINYIELNENHEVTLENVKKAVTPNTKVISLAHVSNVIGDIRPVKEITKYAHQNNILVVIDGAQSVPHMKTDVKDLEVDFLAFSAHKMCGPTGVGILYGKEELLNEMYPVSFGGGMNASFNSDQTREYDLVPRRFEAGTPNIEGIITFGYIIEYINKIGIENIHKYLKKLKKYAIEKLKEVDDIIIYNEDNDSNLITFNKVGIFAQDLAIYLNKRNICIRAGNHCSKMLKEVIDVKNTCRASLYFYNTKEDIDKLVSALKNKNIKEEII